MSPRDLAHNVSEALANSQFFPNKERPDRSRPAQTATIMYHDEGAFEFTQAIESSPIHKGQLFHNRRTGLHRMQAGNVEKGWFPAGDTKLPEHESQILHHYRSPRVWSLATCT